MMYKHYCCCIASILNFRTGFFHKRKSRILLLISIILLIFASQKSSFANRNLDSLYKNSDIVLIGNITDIFPGISGDLGTEIFYVSIRPDTILKQNFWINTTPTQIFWEVSNMSCKEIYLENCVTKYMNGKYFFFLNRNHFYGGAEIPEEKIIPYSELVFNEIVDIRFNSQIVVNHYYKEIECYDDCKLCSHILNEDWRKVEKYISKHANDKEGIPWIKHKRIKWTLTDRYILASLPSSSSTRFNFITQSGEVEALLGYQVGYYKAYALWLPCIIDNLTNLDTYKYFTVEDVDVLILRSFEINTNYSEQYLEFEKVNSNRMLTDSAYIDLYGERMPLPDDYVLLASVFDGELNLYEDYKTMPDYFERAKARIDELEKNKKVYLLCLAATHTIPDIAEHSLKALKSLGDDRCIPFLIYIAEFNLNRYNIGWKESDLHESYLNTLIHTLDELTECETHPQYVPYGMSGNIFDMSLSIPIWKSKIQLLN